MFTFRSLMYSEANRRETFTSWPHVGYRWAQPDPMAQAGFYHQVKKTFKEKTFFFQHAFIVFSKIINILIPFQKLYMTRLCSCMYAFM